MNKYVKYDGMILRVIPGAVYDSGKTIGTVSLENNLNYFIINIEDIETLTEAEYKIAETTEVLYI